MSSWLSWCCFSFRSQTLPSNPKNLESPSNRQVSDNGSYASSKSRIQSNSNVTPAISKGSFPRELPLRRIDVVAAGSVNKVSKLRMESRFSSSSGNATPPFTVGSPQKPSPRAISQLAKQANASPTVLNIAGTSQNVLSTALPGPSSNILHPVN